MKLTGKEEISCLEDIAEHIDIVKSKDRRDNREKEDSGTTGIFPLKILHMGQPQDKTLGGGDKAEIEERTVKRS